jgi:hypothetical protein
MYLTTRRQWARRSAALIVAILATLLASFAAGTASAGASGVVLKQGVTNPAVRTLQQALDSSSHGDFFAYGGGYTSYDGRYTTTGLQRWQAATGHPTTGTITVGDTQWEQLTQEAGTQPATSPSSSLPAGIDQRSVSYAHQDGWAIDASKATDQLYVLRATGGTVSVALATPTSFGGYIEGKQYDTPTGVFRTYRKEGADFKSSIYPKPHGGAPMPYAVFFNGGEAIHQDPLGASHECVHIPSMTDAKYIHDLPLGIALVIHG